MENSEEKKSPYLGTLSLPHPGRWTLGEASELPVLGEYSITPIAAPFWAGRLLGPGPSNALMEPWLIVLSPSPVLFAMKEDNEKVPTLLTDYILKGEHSRELPGVVWS